ncbi:hypothetical protein NX722_11830 [Endozoicomonas gorgoniicola]|uniref:Uncharacterized protein n=1 Tax=Endozoicomonas gorgoniicola TaxID=1234144 RepID=A0ABT3MVB5_9GAMM|nr:hypothetical protein [Endozoicomonas gorgoniicola]MCW7553315.1 hypothetical protein [Endozoicomonas gorgoniicola]
MKLLPLAVCATILISSHASAFESDGSLGQITVNQCIKMTIEATKDFSGKSESEILTDLTFEPSVYRGVVKVKTRSRRFNKVWNTDYCAVHGGTITRSSSFSEIEKFRDTGKSY